VTAASLVAHAEKTKRMFSRKARTAGRVVSENILIVVVVELFSIIVNCSKFFYLPGLLSSKKDNKKILFYF
jgi:hypothetical protein